MATTMTVKEASEKLGTEPRILRKFLRSEVVDAGGKVGEDTPGKGGRYSLGGDSRSFKSLQKRFTTWSEKHTRTTDENESEAEEVEDAELEV